MAEPTVLDRSERLADPEQVQRMALEGYAAGLWTALPGIVQSFDPAAMTVVVQPAIRGQTMDSTGAKSSTALPLLPDVPVVFPSGGGCTLTFPIQQGDECLVIFASRCIDAWWQSGGVQEQAEKRMHDLSDGFAIIGPRSQPRVISSVSTTVAQLRTDDGQTYIEVDPASGGIVTIKSPNTITIDAPGVEFTGWVHTAGDIDSDADMTATGTVTGATDVKAATISLKTHTHGGVQSGGSNTGAPNTGAPNP
jgi:hypothetical protein